MARRRPIVVSLIACGESTWAQDGRIEGAADLPLSDAGRTAVAAAAARGDLGRMAMIHHAPDEAATETARMVAESAGARTKVLEELADPHLGLLEGLAVSGFAERFPKRYKQWQDDPVSVSPPEGEDLADARSRLFAAVAKLLRRSRHDEIGMVLHPVGRGFLTCWLADRPSSELWALIENRPQVERYVLTAEMFERLEEAAAAQTSGAS